MMKRLIYQILFVVSLSVLLFSPVLAQSNVSCDSHSCWTLRSDLPSAASKALFYPDTVVKGEMLYVTGNGVRQPSFMNHSYYASRSNRYTREETASLYTLLGDSLGLPSEDDLFVYPRIAVDSTGTVHLVWNDPAPQFLLSDQKDRDKYDYPMLSHVYYAAYQDGEWSEPERVHQLETGARAWSDENDFPFFIGSDQSLYLMVRDPTAQPSRMRLFRRSEGTWTQRIPSSKWGMTYRSMAEGEDGTLYLAYVSTPHSGGSSIRVFVQRSGDSGQTWSNPTVVNPTMKHVAHKPYLRVDAEGILHLVWVQAGDGPFRGVAWHATSTDQGATWSEPVRVSPVRDASFAHVRLKPDACGGVHLVYRSMNTVDATADLHHRRWKAGEWSEPRTIPTPQAFAFGPALERDADGTLHLFWSSAEHPRWREPVTPHHATLQPCR